MSSAEIIIFFTRNQHLLLYQEIYTTLHFEIFFCVFKGSFNKYGWNFDDVSIGFSRSS